MLHHAAWHQNVLMSKYFEEPKTVSKCIYARLSDPIICAKTKSHHISFVLACYFYRKMSHSGLKSAFSDLMSKIKPLKTQITNVNKKKRGGYTTDLQETFLVLKAY